jgi:hypothetical protein
LKEGNRHEAIGNEKKYEIFDCRKYEKSNHPNCDMGGGLGRPVRTLADYSVRSDFLSSLAMVFRFSERKAANFSILRGDVIGSSAPRRYPGSLRR